MDRELIERLAREADLIHSVTTFRFVNPPNLTPHGELLCRFAELIAEECAKIAESTWEADVGSSEEESGFAQYGENSARAIRERFKP